MWSLVVVPGHDLFDTKDVPRGAVAAVVYWSAALGAFRRMHVYTSSHTTACAGAAPIRPLPGSRWEDSRRWLSRFPASGFGYIGVFSSGLIAQFPELSRRARGAARPAAPPTTGRAAQGPPAQTAAEWQQANAATLDDASLKTGLRLLWFATGKDDCLLTTTQATIDLLEQHGFTPVFKESSGGHTWINWRDYLAEFVPQLFQGE